MLYSRIAREFPEEFQRACGREMVGLTEEMIRQTAAEQGWPGLLPLIFRIFADLIAQLIGEYTNEISNDVRYSIRHLWNTPGFTAIAAFSLAIGIGMVTSMYTQLDSTVFRNTPGVGNPREVVVTIKPVSYPLYESIRDHSGQFDSLAAVIAPVPFVAMIQKRKERVWGQLVTDGYFHAVGVTPLRGRVFSSIEGNRQATPTAVVSHRFWKNKLLSDPEVVGSSLQINGHLVTVIGVAPVDFLGASPLAAVADIWIPATAQNTIAPELGRNALEDRKIATFSLIGRLKQGVQKDQAETVLDNLARRLEVENNDPGRENKAKRVRLVNGGRLVPLDDKDLPKVAAFPMVLGGLTLWISCANVATMMLVRAAKRRREISIRLAMGASRTRIIRLLITESLILALLSGLGGFVFTYINFAATDRFRPMLPNFMELNFYLDWRIFAINMAISALVGIVFGLAPALQTSRLDLNAAIKEGTNPPLRGYRWFSSRNLLVLQQVAGSLALLLITGYVILGFQRSNSVNLGFDPDHLSSMSLDPVREGYDAQQTLDFFQKLPDKLRSNPSVLSVALSQAEPVRLVSGAPSEVKNSKGAMLKVNSNRVGANYFQTLGIPMVQGREFEWKDAARENPVIIVNENLAMENWPAQQAIGQTLEIKGKKHEVIGVVKSFRSSYAMETSKQILFHPMKSTDFTNPDAEGIHLVVRTQPGVDAAEVVRSEMARSDATLTVFQVHTMEQAVSDMRYMLETTMRVYGGIGLFGLILAAIGLSGVTAYAVAQRTREIGIRVALGAQRNSVVGLVMKEATVIALIGISIGQGCAFGLTQLLSSQFSAIAEVMHTSVGDPLLAFGAPVLLATLTIIAAYLPARRALRIDPVTALRCD